MRRRSLIYGINALWPYANDDEEDRNLEDGEPHDKIA